MDIENVYGEKGLLSDIFEGYEPRVPQIKYATMVDNFLNDDEKNIAILEGAVGVGKTFGYLIPAIQKTPVVIATSSNTLLDQLIQKDLPIISEMFDVSFAGLKGINNYLCQRLYDEVEVFDIKINKDGSKGDEVDWKEWSEVTTTSQECLKKKCSHFDTCYYQRAKERASSADVVVVNHHLLAAYIYIKEIADISILPEFETLIIDEVHELENSIISFHTKILNGNVIDKISNKFIKASNNIDDSKYSDPEGIAKKTLQIIEMFKEFPFELLKKDIEEVIKENQGQLIEKEFEHFSLHVDRLNKIGDLIDSMIFMDTDKEEFVMPPTIDSFQRYFVDIMTRIEWVMAKPSNIAMWENDNKIKITNIDVSGFLEPMWNDTSKNFILTSATIMVNRKTDFLKDRLGIGNSVEGIFGSPFNYENQAKLLIPRKNNPKNKERFMELVLENIDKIVTRGYDKTLILFTSYKDMQYVLPKLKVKYKNVLSQSKNFSKGFLLDRFQKLDKSILVAQAASFGTGVDIKGDKNIIIIKLNFDVPTDPLFVAQGKVIEERGGNPFYELSIPNVAIRTKQQVGRGIRTTTDKANIAILDGRLLTTAWGRVVFNSLPKMKYFDKI